MGEGRLARAHDLRRRAETHLVSAGWLTARELMQDALQLYEQEADTAGATACLRGLGEVAFKLGETGPARELYRRAIDVARRTGDRAGEAEGRLREADLLRSEKKWKEAEEALREAGAICEEVGDRRGQARSLGLLGEVRREIGSPAADVIGAYRDAHRLQMEAGDRKAAAVTLGFLANYLKARDPSGAAEAFLEAGRLYEGLGLVHRAEPFYAAARRLDPERAPPASVRPPGPWDSDDE